MDQQTRDKERERERGDPCQNCESWDGAHHYRLKSLSLPHRDWGPLSAREREGKTRVIHNCRCMRYVTGRCYWSVGGFTGLSRHNNAGDPWKTVKVFKCTDVTSSGIGFHGYRLQNNNRRGPCAMVALLYEGGWHAIHHCKRSSSVPCRPCGGESRPNSKDYQRLFLPGASN
jgi:hypothetical protein